MFRAAGCKGIDVAEFLSHRIPPIDGTIRPIPTLPPVKKEPGVRSACRVGGSERSAKGASYQVTQMMETELHTRDNKIARLDKELQGKEGPRQPPKTEAAECRWREELVGGGLAQGKVRATAVKFQMQRTTSSSSASPGPSVMSSYVLLHGMRKRDNGVKKKRHRKQPTEDVEGEYVGSDSDTTTPCDLETMDSSSNGNETREDDECGDGASEDGEGEAQRQGQHQSACKEL
ncbi:hypothetical protein EJB05_54768, partial [Eragrostis curvula]